MKIMYEYFNTIRSYSTKRKARNNLDVFSLLINETWFFCAVSYDIFVDNAPYNGY